MAFRAVWALTGAYLRLRLFPVRQIRAWAEAQGSRHRNQGSVMRAFYRVASRIPATCLTRAFALQRLLSQHGHATELRIGVQRGAETLEAHAWLVDAADNVLVGAGQALDSYTVIAQWHDGKHDGADA